MPPANRSRQEEVTMARVGVLQHFGCEHSGVFGEALREVGHELQTVALLDGAAVPGAGEFDTWLVMGGPMNVDEVERYAWLRPERALLAELIAADRPVMGVCLGAQLIARAAGARVYATRPKEIGLFPVELTPAAAEDPLFRLFENPQEVFQWHGDTFEQPAGAVQLARSARCEQQAFRVGRRVYGVQFHLECTGEIVANLRKACARELAALPPEDAFEQFDDRLEAALARQNELAREVIHRWAALFD
jgi:GMP synthase-like glutamine amidotransferase